jgi:hypothetical protein
MSKTINTSFDEIAFKTVLANELLGRFPKISSSSDSDVISDECENDLFKIVESVIQEYFLSIPGGLKNISRKWASTIKYEMSRKPSDNIINALRSCEFINPLSTPYIYHNVQIIPLRSALELYEEERRLHNDLILEILSILEGRYYIFSIRDMNNESLTYLEVVCDESGMFRVSEHTGKNYIDPDKACSNAAIHLVNYLNSLHTSTGIQNIIDKVGNPELTRLSIERDESVDGFIKYYSRLEEIHGLSTLPPGLLKSTIEFKIDALREVMGAIEINMLIDQVSIRCQFQNSDILVQH